MKRFMMFAMLLGALSLGSCVDDTETQSVTDVRNAKAEQLKAAADLANAQAAAAKTQAEAQKALAEAQAEYQKAQAAAAKIAAEAEAALKQAEAAKLEAEAAVAKAQAEKIAAEAAVELAKAEQIAAQTEAERAQAEANLKKAQAEAEKAMADAQKAQAEADAAKADAEAAKAQAEAAKKEAELAAAQYVAQLETLKLETEAEIARLEAEIANAKAQMENDKNQLVVDRFNAYTRALRELNEFKSTLIEKQLDLALTESGFVSEEEANQKLIAGEEEKIARYENEIEAFKEYKGYDKAQLKKQADELAKQYNMAIYEFETNPVCAAVVATNEPIEKAFNDVQKQTELVKSIENVLNSNFPVLNTNGDSRNYPMYRVVTCNTQTISNRLIGYVYTGISVNEVEKTKSENQLAHDIESAAELLGTPEDRSEMSTAYGYMAYAKKNYDRAVADLEKVKGQFKEVIEAFKKAETDYYDAKDKNEVAQAAAIKANEDAAKAAEAVDKAQAKADEAAAKLLEAQKAYYDALQLPDSDKDKAKKVDEALAARTKAEQEDKTAQAELKAAKDAKTAADKAAGEANKAAATAQEAFDKAAAAYNKAQDDKSDADVAVRDAEEAVVSAQERVSSCTAYLNSVQKSYDDAVKAQKDFAEAFAALDIEAVLAATAALDEAEAVRDEAEAAFEEAKAPIRQLYQNYMVAKDMYENCYAIDVEKEISDREQWIAECQKTIDGIKATMANEDAEANAAIDLMKAQIAELEKLIEIQTDLVDKAKASLDAALAE